ncbi:MAG: Lrp/AsnC family transcriptional regulator [Muribaculaceae bacterium]|nr:Lrp/AsnC family transcriptional regulator [Muribaculaceae bacterium]
MSRQYFDNLDLTILRALVANARTPYLEIARAYGVSGAAVHQRVQRLLASKVIIGSRCLVDPDAAGYSVSAYLGLNLLPGTQLDDVINQLKSIPEIVECSIVAGQYDILIKVMARDNDHMLALIQEKIRPLPLSASETMVAFKEAFSRSFPINND